ncbi:hypothetical protein F5Y15DRAFT_412929 [Xylariaceae sp. FL0016]|nr:hypothetical protein F5Y15DRAFT_412929 [Xylariaceae sp. FL0016]
MASELRSSSCFAIYRDPFGMEDKIVLITPFMDPYFVCSVSYLHEKGVDTSYLTDINILPGAHRWHNVAEVDTEASVGSVIYRGDDHVTKPSVSSAIYHGDDHDTESSASSVIYRGDSHTARSSVGSVICRGDGHDVGPNIGGNAYQDSDPSTDGSDGQLNSDIAPRKTWDPKHWESIVPFVPANATSQGNPNLSISDASPDTSKLNTFGDSDKTGFALIILNIPPECDAAILLSTLNDQEAVSSLRIFRSDKTISVSARIVYNSKDAAETLTQRARQGQWVLGTYLPHYQRLYRV